jgi:hypothetical protein
MSRRRIGKATVVGIVGKLRDYLIESGRATTISIETVRRILHERGVTWHTTKTWKASTDLTSPPKVW